MKKVLRSDANTAQWL